MVMLAAIDMLPLMSLLGVTVLIASFMVWVAIRSARSHAAANRKAEESAQPNGSVPEDGKVAPPLRVLFSRWLARYVPVTLYMVFALLAVWMSAMMICA